MSTHFQIESALLSALVAALPLLVALFFVRKTGANTAESLRKDMVLLQKSLQDQQADCQAKIASVTQDSAVTIKELKASHCAALEKLSAQHAQALAAARNELSIVSFPYEDISGDDGWIVDDRTAEVGYKYQLFIRGVPCFEPHKVVTNRIQKKEVNQAKIDRLKADVTRMLEIVASKHPAFSVTQKFAQVR